jgi:hypothetical protein
MKKPSIARRTQSCLLLSIGACIASSVVDPDLARGRQGIRHAGSAAAQAKIDMDVIEFLADWKATIGKVVTIDGCKIAGFVSDAVGCYGDTAQTRVLIDSGTLDRKSLRSALENCVGLMPAEACQVSVSGWVEEDSFHRPRLRNVVVTWRAR